MIVVYGRVNCIWCERTIMFLESVNEEYVYKQYGIDYTREELVELVGTDTNLTVPQIFIDGVLVGGYSEFVTQYMKG